MKTEFKLSKEILDRQELHSGAGAGLLKEEFMKSYNEQDCHFIFEEFLDKLSGDKLNGK